MTMSELDDLVQEYLIKLEHTRPCIRNQRFQEHSYAIWACTEILRGIHNSGDLPFDVSSYELLDQFAERMKRYACEHKEKARSLCFVQAAETAEYIRDELYWTDEGDWRHPINRKKRRMRK